MPDIGLWTLVAFGALAAWGGSALADARRRRLRSAALARAAAALALDHGPLARARRRGALLPAAFRLRGDPRTADVLDFRQRFRAGAGDPSGGPGDAAALAALEAAHDEPGRG